MSFTFTEFPDTSYYHSDLRQILKRLREIDATLDSYDEVIAELKEELTKIDALYPRVSSLEQHMKVAESNIVQIRADLDTMERRVLDMDAREEADVKELNRLISDLTREVHSIETGLDAIYTYIDAGLSDVRLFVSQLYTRLTMEFEGLKYRLEAEISRLKERIDALDTSVKNPWHLEEGRVEQDRNEKLVYKDLADNVPTAIEYCKLGLTADEYSAYSLTAIKYARFGKQKLHYYWVYDPRTGNRQDINNVLTSIIDTMYNTITADAYTAKELTADDYTALELSAFDYYKYL